jgi:glycerol-3-phosphate acyltransferase PlsY
MRSAGIGPPPRWMWPSALLRTGDGTPDGNMPLQHAMPAVIVTAAVALLVVWAHRANIARLRAGTESRLGAKKP